MDANRTASDELPRIVRVKKARGRDIVYLPTRQHHTKKAVFAGVVCRAVLAAVFVFGLCLFIADGFGMVPDKTEWTVILYAAFFFSAAITLICRGGRLSAVGIVAVVGGVFARIAMFSVDIIDIITESAAVIHNTVIDKLVDVGLTSVYTLRLETSNSGIYSESDLYAIGLMLLTLLLSVFFVPVIVRKCSAIYITVATAVFTVPTFMYNIMRSNWGFAVLISAIAGTLVLWMHDRGYTTRSRKKRFVKDDETIPMFDTEERKKHRRREKIEDSEDIYRLESNSDRRRRLKEARRERRGLEKEEKKAARIRKKDERKNERLDRRTVFDNTALGGVTGLCTMILSLLIIALPAHFVEESNPKIPLLSDIIDHARDYVTAYMTSDSVDLNHTSQFVGGTISEGPRPTEPTYPEYNNVVVMTVEAPRNMPVYLRSWIGTKYANDQWYSASLREVDRYRDRFGELFTPEMITENFYTALYPDFATYGDEDPYVDNTTLGFVTERVSVTRKEGNTNLLYLPSFVRPSRGLMMYNSSVPALLPYKTYFDGVWTSKFFFDGTRYTTESFVTTMRYQDLGYVFSNGIREYFATLELIRSGEPDNMIGADDEMKARYVETYENIFAHEYGITFGEKSLLYRYIYEMTAEERQATVEGALLEEAYSEYVNQTYLQTDDEDNSLIRLVAIQALRESGINGTVGTVSTDDYHSTVMALIHYLSAHYTYSKKPPEMDPHDSADAPDTTYPPDETQGEDDVPDGAEGDVGQGPEESSGESAVVEFLTETRTGYCVQFASSLTLMLRSIGIPARYCEGYIASNFKMNTEDEVDDELRYYCDVLDSNAHAWVEVYYPGLGWVQYEATPSYHDAMYGRVPGDGDGPPDKKPDIPDKKDPVPPPVNDTPVEEEPPVEIPVEDPHARMVRAIIIASVAAGTVIVLAVVFYFWMLKRRSDKVLRDRAALIGKCRDTEGEMTAEELRSAAHEIDLGIFDVYRALHLDPDTGELRAEYAARLADAIGGASSKAVDTVLELISREEFGGVLSREGLATLAEYYDDLTRNVYDGLSLKNKFLMRGIMRVV